MSVPIPTDEQGDALPLDPAQPQKVFACPKCGSTVFSEYMSAVLVNDFKAVLNEQTKKAERTQVEEHLENREGSGLICCVKCEAEFSWQEIKEALEPKRTQLTLTENAKPTPASSEETPCATNVETTVSPAESSLNAMEKKTSTSAPSVDTTSTEQDAPAEEDKEKTEP